MFTLPFQPQNRLLIHSSSGFEYAPVCELPAYKNVKRIQYNTTKVKNFLIVDLDNQEQENNYLNSDIPTPHIIIKNKGEKFGKHLIWVLDKPVWGVNQKQYNLWLNINKELTKQCGGDKNYTFHIAKNLYNNDDFEVTFNDKDNYSLSVFRHLLNNPIHTPKKAVQKRFIADVSNTLKVSNKVEIGTRNITMFNTVRKYAYQEVQKSVNNQAFTELVHLYAYNFNERLEERLDITEVEATARSIVKYCLKNKSVIKNATHIKRGVMNLEASKLLLKEKQKLAAEYSAKKKSVKTEMRIEIAIKEMQAKELKINITTLAKYLKISRNTIKNYRDLLNKLLVVS